MVLIGCAPHAFLRLSLANHVTQVWSPGQKHVFLVAVARWKTKIGTVIHIRVNGYLIYLKSLVNVPSECLDKL